MPDIPRAARLSNHGEDLQNTFHPNQLCMAHGYELHLGADKYLITQITVAHIQYPPICT